MTILRWKDIAGQMAFHAARNPQIGLRPVGYHGHDFAEIFWIDAGHGVHAINDTTQPLQPGSLVLMRPTDRHGISANEQGKLKLTNIAFPRSTLDFLRSRYFYRQEWLFSSSEKYPIMRQIGAPQLHRFNRWADELSQSPRQRLFLERFLLNILSELSLNRQDALPAGLPGWLAEACHAIHQADHFSKGVEEFCGYATAAGNIRRDPCANTLA